MLKAHLVKLQYKLREIRALQVIRIEAFPADEDLYMVFCETVGSDKYMDRAAERTLPHKEYQKLARDSARPGLKLDRV